MGLFLKCEGPQFLPLQTIAEGAAGRSGIQFKNFLSISIGSLNELSTQFEIAFRIGYIDDRNYYGAQKLLDECLAVTVGLKKSLSRS